MTSKKLTYLPNCKYSILQLTLDDLKDKYYSGLEEVALRKIDGVLIKRIFSPELCEIIHSKALTLPSEVKFEIHGCGGFLYPITFNQLRDDENYLSHRQRYFHQSKTVTKEFFNPINVDVQNILNHTFSLISGGKSVNVLPGLSSEENMLPVSIRVFEPKKGGVLPHCHNTYDEELHPDFVTHLSNYIGLRHQLSFFVTLKKPESGGQLTLFNIEHKDAKCKQDDRTIMCDNGIKFDTSLPSNKNLIEVDQGDMIIFAGGDIWHQVEDIGGAENRVTLGGFGNFSKNNNEFYYWS